MHVDVRRLVLAVQAALARELELSVNVGAATALALVFEMQLVRLGVVHEVINMIVVLDPAHETSSLLLVMRNAAVAFRRHSFRDRHVKVLIILLFVGV
jgi:hypothetical protein